MTTIIHERGEVFRGKRKERGVRREKMLESRKMKRVMRNDTIKYNVVVQLLYYKVSIITPRWPHPFILKVKVMELISTWILILFCTL